MKFPSWLLLLVLGGVLFGLGWWMGQRDDSEVPSASEPATAVEKVRSGPSDASPKDSGDLSTTPQSEPKAPSESLDDPGSNPARIAIVIDDFGRSLTEVENIESLGIPISYAVLPFEVRTEEVVKLLEEKQVEVLLHLPMEPGNGKNPGLGALTAGMTEQELRSSTRKALAAVPGATGVNNHMGSRLTSDAAVMEVVMDEIASRSVYFLDSRTSSESTAYQTALRHGIPAAERHVFLDTDASEAAILDQCQRLAQLAREKGSAIAIGHPYPSTQKILKSWLAREGREFEFVPVSHLLDRPGSGPLE